jgi:hypothetical protein
MPSDRQIEANRRNAKKSTGPSSPEGKLRSSQNALSHGLTSASALLPGEDSLLFEHLGAALKNELCPVGELETDYTSRIAGLCWRLRRVDGLEAALIQWQTHCEAQIHDRAKLWDKLDVSGANVDPRFLGDAATEGGEDASDDQRAILKLGRAVEASLRSVLKLDGYAASLHRQRSALLKELLELQARRQQRSKLIEGSVTETHEL